ncbi:hypothetical protein EAE96_009474 [Botrytis aclada]|nr:hypothetical protein EAE96_009474 [Botrytis aclada]
MCSQRYTNPSGPWDEKYPELSLDPGRPSPSPTIPIVYPKNPGDPYIMKSLSHSWPDVSNMIVHRVHSWKDVESHPIYDQLNQSIEFNQDPYIVLVQFMEIYNDIFFAGMIKSSFVGDFAHGVDEINFNLELVSDGAHPVVVELDGSWGLTDGSFDGEFFHVTIYIVDRRSEMPNRGYHEVIVDMLGALAHEMIHAMEFMYAKDADGQLGVIYAPHGSHFQKAAQAIEQATGESPEGEGWIYPKIELDRESHVALDVVSDGYEEPTDTELQNMGLDVGKFREIFWSLRAMKDEIDQSA